MGVRVKSPWDGVPDPDPLKELVKTLKCSSEASAKRQRAINLLNAAIMVMKTVKGREPAIEYISGAIEEARNDMYPARNSEGSNGVGRVFHKTRKKRSRKKQRR